MDFKHTSCASFRVWRRCCLLMLVLIVPSGDALQAAGPLPGPDDRHRTYPAMRPATAGSAPRLKPLTRLPVPDSHGPTPDSSRVQRAAYNQPGPLVALQPDDSYAAPEVLSAPLPAPSSAGLPGETYPLDLPTALGLAGANNLQIAFSAERVRQALARMDQADLIWVPSINAGVIYNNHAGRLQETEGKVIEVNRSSLFAGAGAVTAFSATAGGASGPARMVVDLPLVDALFEPLAARQVVRAAEADQATTFNDTLLRVAVAYLNLLGAHSQVAIAREAVNNAEQLAKITADFARAGEGLEADAERVRAELDSRRRDLLRTRERVAVASAELVRLLRLDPAVILVPTDPQAAPIDVVEDDAPLQELIAMAFAGRPEVNRDDVVDETWLRARQERIRPWLPNVYAGFSGGGFGGGTGSSVTNFSDRTDFDVGAVWELQNMGLGNAARARQQRSVYRQARIAADQTRDLIASEVSSTFHQVQLRREQIGRSRSQVNSAQRSLQLNLEGIRNEVLRAIEAQQAITALAAARGEYLDSVIGFNRAQFELLRAIGQPVYQ